MRRIFTVGLAGMALTGCSVLVPRTEGPPVSTPRPAAMPPHLTEQTIRYETTPCYGRCPVYTITIDNRGEGVFTGTRFTAVTGERRFHATPEQFDAFAWAISPYMPGRGELLIQQGTKLCKNVATDMPSVDIVRTRAGRGTDHLNLYFGCDMEKNRAVKDALGNAPDKLPIEDLIGARP